MTGTSFFTSTTELWPSFLYLAASVSSCSGKFAPLFLISRSSVTITLNFPPLPSQTNSAGLSLFWEIRPALPWELQAIKVHVQLSGGLYLHHQNHLSGGDALLCTDVGLHDCCWESVGGSNAVGGVFAPSWESPFLKWNILEIGCAMCRWNETMCSDSIWPWSGYHRGLNIPPYTGFSSPRGCVSSDIISSLFGMKKFSCKWKISFDTTSFQFVWVFFISWLKKSLINPLEYS